MRLARARRALKPLLALACVALGGAAGLVVCLFPKSADGPSSLSFASTEAPAAARARRLKAIDDAASDFAIADFARAYQNVRTPSEYAAVFGSFLPARDRADFAKKIAALPALPKLEREGRKLTFRFKGFSLVWELVELRSGLWKVNGDAWTYRPAQPYGEQAEYLAKRLFVRRRFSAWQALALPAAEARSVEETAGAIDSLVRIVEISLGINLSQMTSAYASTIGTGFMGLVCDTELNNGVAVYADGWCQGWMQAKLMPLTVNFDVPPSPAPEGADAFNPVCPSAENRRFSIDIASPNRPERFTRVLITFQKDEADESQGLPRTMFLQEFERAAGAGPTPASRAEEFAFDRATRTLGFHNQGRAHPPGSPAQRTTVARADLGRIQRLSAALAASLNYFCAQNNYGDLIAAARGLSGAIPGSGPGAAVPTAPRPERSAPPADVAR